MHYDNDNENNNGYANHNDGSGQGQGGEYYGASTERAEWWRFGVGAMWCTNVVQIVCNIFVLSFLNGRERDVGTWNVLLTFMLSVLCGGFFSILDTYGGSSSGIFGLNYGSGYNGDGSDVIQVTGLNCAGIIGVITLILTEMMLFGRDHYCYDNYRLDDLKLTATVDDRYEERRSRKMTKMRKGRRSLAFGQRLKLYITTTPQPLLIIASG